MKDVFAGKAVGGATSEAIAEFEDFIHAKLPTEYRQFLALFGGGIPAPETCALTTAVELAVGHEFEVSQLYSLLTDHEHLLNLGEALENNLGWIGHTSIPIGHDEIGNLICLDCETGTVEWLCLDQAFTLDYTRIYDLKVSFAEFIEGLGAASS